MLLPVGRQRPGISKRCRGTSHGEHQPPCCSAAAWCQHPDTNSQGTGAPLALPAGAPCPKRSQGGLVLALSLWSSRGTRPAAPTTSSVAAKLHMCSQSLVLQTPACHPDRPRGARPWGAGDQGAAPPRGPRRGQEPGSPGHQQH